MKKSLLLIALFAIFNTAIATPLHYFGQTEHTYQSQTDYGNNAQTGHYALSDGTKIYYEVYGQGKPIVVLHGGLVGSPAEMGQFIDVLSKNHQVIAVNTRGHGKSEVGNTLPTYAQKAKDVKAVLQAVGVKQADFLGFSDGGYTALTFASQFPDLTGKVVAIGAGEWQKGFVQGGRNPNATFADLEKPDPRYWQEQQTIRPNPAQTDEWFKQANQAYNQTEISQNVLTRIQNPVLLVVGEDDQNAPLNTVISAYKMLSNADLAVIANAPHPVFMVNFDAVWANIEPFLNKK